MVRDDTGSSGDDEVQRQLTQEVVDTPVVVRGSREENENTELQRRSLKRERDAHTISPSSRPHFIPSGTSYAQEDRSSSVSRDASITPNREQDQGPFTLEEEETETVRREDRTSDHRHDHCIKAARGFDRVRAAD